VLHAGIGRALFADRGHKLTILQLNLIHRSVDCGNINTPSGANDQGIRAADLIVLPCT
jgi:hypothetical protein